MTDARAGQECGGGYEIRIMGHLDDRWSAWFDAMTLTRENDGTTLIRAEVTDQAALHGLLQKVHDVGLPLISVAGARPAALTPADSRGRWPPRSTPRGPPG